MLSDAFWNPVCTQALTRSPNMQGRQRSRQRPSQGLPGSFRLIFLPSLSSSDRPSSFNRRHRPCTRSPTTRGSFPIECDWHARGFMHHSFLVCDTSQRMIFITFRYFFSLSFFVITGRQAGAGLDSRCQVIMMRVGILIPTRACSRQTRKVNISCPADRGTLDF